MRLNQPQINDWLQRLYTLQVENVALKNLLAGKMQTTLKMHELEQVEYLQTQLINSDAAISLLRHELNARAKQPEPGLTDSEQAGMESSVSEMEKNWLQLKHTFDLALSA